MLFGAYIIKEHKWGKTGLIQGKKYFLFFSYILGGTDSFITKYTNLKFAVVILDRKSSVRSSLGLHSPGHAGFC